METKLLKIIETANQPLAVSELARILDVTVEDITEPLLELELAGLVFGIRSISEEIRYTTP